MSAVRIRVYEDQFEGLQVEVDGKTLTPGDTIPAWIDNVDVRSFVQRLLTELVREIPLENVEVTD